MMKKAVKVIITLWVIVMTTESYGQKIWKVLDGDYADPSIIRVGTDFYMTHSSYNYVPGLLIWHSTDLKNWKPLTYALNKYVGDVWAPDFIVHNNKYYIYFPSSKKNYVVTADSPNGPWSDPIDLNSDGIDPGHVATPDGKRYLYFNNGWMIQLADDGLSTVGEKRKVYDGWPIPPHWPVECFCLESPKFNYLNGYYYLVSAQGGTAGPATSHMVVTARATSPEGPWENSPYNPLVHTWSSSERWWSKGHGTLFDDAKGNWYVVYHAYEKNNLAAGRQVLIEPVKWTKDNWVVLKRNPVKEPVTLTFDNLKTENDDFSGKNLKFQWQLSGVQTLENIRFTGETLELSSSDVNLKAIHTNTADEFYTVTVKMKPSAKTLEYGLVLFYNQENYVGISVHNERISGIERGEKKFGPILKKGENVYYRLIRHGNDVQMAYSSDGKFWNFFPTSIDVSGMNHNVLKEFRNLKIGIYVKGNGTLSIDDFVFVNEVSGNR
jgi:xylan 1,4-beta-xylosidase